MTLLTQDKGVGQDHDQNDLHDDHHYDHQFPPIYDHDQYNLDFDHHDYHQSTPTNDKPAFAHIDEPEIFRDALDDTDDADIEGEISDLVDSDDDLPECADPTDHTDSGDDEPNFDDIFGSAQDVPSQGLSCGLKSIWGYLIAFYCNFRHSTLRILYYAHLDEFEKVK